MEKWLRELCQGFKTRYAKFYTGVDAAHQIKQRSVDLIQTLPQKKTKYEVIETTVIPQPSIVISFVGSDEDLKDEFVVVGGLIQTQNQGNPNIHKATDDMDSIDMDVAMQYMLFSVV